MKQFFGTFLFLLFTSTSIYAQTDIWVETFTYPDGTTQVTTGPTQWSTDISNATIVPPNDYFEVRSNLLAGRDLDGEVLWISQSIDISGYSNITISLDVTESGPMDFDDYVRAYYNLDGAGDILFGEHTDDIPNGQSVTLSTGGLSGSTVIITVAIFNNFGNEIFKIDNVGVREIGDLFSIGNSTWSDTNNWSSTSSGPACGCLPTAFTGITIQSGHTIDIDGSYSVNGITVESTGTLRWINGGGDLAVSGDVTINSGGEISANGQTTAVLDFSGASNIIVNDVSTGLSLETFHVSGSDAIVNISGNGLIQINNDILIEGNNHNITNDFTGTFTVTNEFHFGAASTGNTFTNNQTITIGTDILFNDDDCSVVNNGTISLGDDVLVSGNNDINNSITNNSGAIINLDEVRLGNGDGFVFTNFGTVNQAGDFVNGIPTSNTFTNRETGIWNFGGASFDTALKLYTASVGSQFNYTAAGDQDIITPQDNYHHLTLAGTGVKAALAALDIDGVLTINSTLDMSANALTVAGDFVNTGTFTAGPAVTMDGANQNMASGTAIFNNLVIDGTLVKTLTDNLTIVTDITINSSLDVTASNFQINVGGNLTNNGTLTTHNGTILFDGSADQQIGGSASTGFYGLVLNKSGGRLLIEGNVTLASSLNIQSASEFDADGAGAGIFTILSNSSGDASVSTLPAGASISGQITVQRYLPNAAASRAWRHVGSSVTGGTVSDWKADVPITGTFNDPSLPAEWPGITGIVSNSPSMYRYMESLGGLQGYRWETYPLNGTSSTAASLEVGRGYALYVRSTGTETLDARGTATTGAVGVSVTSSGATIDDGWNLISNPYPSGIDWDNVTIPAGVNNEIHFQDNVNNGGAGAGSYIRYVGGVGTPLSYTGEIAMGQAFWVRATANATITFQEDDKISGTSQFFKTKPFTNLLRVKLIGSDGFDEMVVRFEPDATDLFDKGYDAGQKNLFKNSISTVLEDGRLIAINTLNGNFCDKSIPMVILGTDPGNYQLDFYNLESFTDYKIKLIDDYLGTMQPIESNQIIAFDITSDTASYGYNRFTLEFTKIFTSKVVVKYPTQICDQEQVAIELSGTIPVRIYSLFDGFGQVGDPVRATGSNLRFEIASSPWNVGTKSYYVIIKMPGCSKEIRLNNITIEKSMKPVAPEVTSQNVCFEGYAQMEITSDDGVEYRWYTSIDAPDPVLITESKEYTTGFLQENTYFYVSGVNAQGCEGARTEVETNVIKKEVPLIVLEEDLITSSIPDGNQWFYNGEIMQGDTLQTVKVLQEGAYHVSNIQRGCIAESESVMYLITALEAEIGGQLNLYPNPVKGILNVSIERDILEQVLSIEIVDLQGRIQYRVNPGIDTGFQIDVKPLEKGIYILRISLDDRSYNRRFIKE